MASKTYAEKLKNPLWQKKRLDILSRDNWTCCVTGCHETTKTLHVHHLDYISGKEPWEYPNEYFITVCEDCHEEISNERPIFEKELIKQFRLKLKDPFIQKCTVELFNNLSADQLHGIMFMLWQIKDNPQELHDGVQRFYWEATNPQIESIKKQLIEKGVING